MNTDTLIRQLAANAEAVRRLPPVRVRLGLWVLAALAICGVSFVLPWSRGRGPGAAMAQLEFGAQAVLTFTAATAAAAAGLVLSIPGRERPWTTRALPLVILGSWMVWLGTLVLASGSASAGWMAPPAVKCAVHVVAAGAPAGVLLVLLVRAGAPLEARWAGVMVALAAGATGALATQLACENREAPHLLLWHALPVVALAAAGMLPWIAGRLNSGRAGVPSVRV